MMKDDSGKLVLESTLVYPILLLVTIGAIFYALSTGLQGAVFAQTDLAASRAAFVWDNSHRNPVTGAYYPGQYDDLYWRLTSDFDDSGLAERKLSAAIAGFTNIPDRSANYDNQVWRRQVFTRFAAPLHEPAWMPRVHKQANAVSRSSSIVTDPVEWVRMIDLTRLYWPKVKKAVSPAEADRMVDEFRRRGDAEREPLSFHSHNEARSYMQTLVGGRLSRIDTEEVGEWRMIDALDRHGIAHQAYFGLKKNDKSMRDQLLKDAELMRAGKLKGVTWHFFRKYSDGSIGLTDQLRRDLEKRGIVIVVHE